MRFVNLEARNLSVRVYRRSGGRGACYAMLDLGGGDVAIIDGGNLGELEERLERELGAIAQSRDIMRWLS
jgi:hypothetical protein